MPEAHGHTFRVVYVGIEKGWFAEEGLSIEFLPVPGGAVNLVPQLAAGAGEVAWAGGYTIVQARARGVPVKAVHSASTESLWGFITREDSGIESPADLAGRTLGVISFSSATYFMMQALLQSGGLSLEDVDVQPVGMGGAASLMQGQIDGYIWFKSQGLALQIRGEPVRILEMEPHFPLPQDSMLVNERFAAEHPERIQAYLRVLKRAEEYDVEPENYEEGNSYLAMYAPEAVTDEVFLRALYDFNVARHNRDKASGWRWGEISAERLALAQDYLLRTGVISEPTPVEEMFSNAYLPA
jgi:ABC-type nitrate/sulfonate/bicarbonate transport system substrate-binding protein